MAAAAEHGLAVREVDGPAHHFLRLRVDGLDGSKFLLRDRESLLN
jgi:hypothetical protein